MTGTPDATCDGSNRAQGRLASVPLVRVLALLVALAMAVGSAGLWIATPLAALWVGSRVQAATGSMGSALIVAFAVAAATAIALALVLARLDQAYRALRGGRSALERMLVISAAIAVTGFTIWFFGFAGPGPLIAPR